MTILERRLTNAGFSEDEIKIISSCMEVSLSDNSGPYELYPELKDTTEELYRQLFCDEHIDTKGDILSCSVCSSKYAVPKGSDFVGLHTRIEVYNLCDKCAERMSYCLKGLRLVLAE